jgi:predicted ATPase/DNA-binding XRE family transcriptional regulator
MESGVRSFGAQLKALREAASFTQEELATISGLSVHAVSSLERGERRRPQFDTVRALSAALDLPPHVRNALLASARGPAQDLAVEVLGGVSLPLPPTLLLGREAELEVLQQWIADPTARLITLTGPGGVGKTRLALELAHTLASEDPGRVRFVSLAVIRDASFVASTIAEAFGLRDVTGRDLPQRVGVVCHDAPTWLVLDNFEHVLVAAPLLGDLLTAVASLRLLVTSRAPVHLRGEREYAIGPLPLETGGVAMAPADLARVPAVHLFVDRVRDVLPDFRLTLANGPTVSAICRRLDGLPLALELAATWVKALAPEGLLRRLEGQGLLSTEGPRDLPERQQTMNATVAWSYQLLRSDEQRAFRRFGALPGLFPLDAAAAVLAGRTGPGGGTDDALRSAISLLDKSLLLRSEVSVVPTCPLYYMLETVRAYAVKELTAADEHADALEGLVRYCTTEASLAAEGLVGPSQVTWLGRVREDLESYRAALGWLIAHGRTTEAADIAWALLWFWVIRGHATEGLGWYEQILDHSSLPPRVASRMLAGASSMCYVQGDLERAQTAIAKALAPAEESDDRAMIAHAAIVWGHIEQARGNITEARDRFTQGLEGFQALASPWGTGHTLSALAWAALATGDAAHAERLLDESRSALRTAGPWFLGLGLNLRAVLAVQRGNPREALACARESLARMAELQDTFAFVYTLAPLAAAAGLIGDEAWVARIVGVRDAVTEQTGAMAVDPLMQNVSARTEREARARLGPDRWAQAYAAGRAASIEALLRDIAEAIGD